MSHRLSRVVYILLAVGFASCLAFSRAPDCFSGLSENEVHFNAPLLTLPGLSDVREETRSLMRPLLGASLWKAVYHKRLGLLEASERGLHVLPLAFSLLHTLILLLVPWTRHRAARLTAALLVGLSAVESQNAVEAQSYSFISLMGSLLFLGMAFSLKLLDEGKTAKAGALCAAALLLSANTHFFNIGLIVPVFLFWLAYSAVAIDEKKTRRRTAACSLLAAGGIAGFTLLLNKPSFEWLFFFSRVNPSANGVFSLKGAFPFLAPDWDFSGLPTIFFYQVAAVSLLHPARRMRFVSGALLAAVTVFKLFLCAYCLSKSWYGPYDRHLIMFLGPSAMLFGLGMDSGLHWAHGAWRRRYNLSPLPLSIFLAGVLALSLLGRPLADALAGVQNGMTLWRIMPKNHTLEFFFFERVKKLNGPVLTLTNHPWAKDKPMLYLSGALGGAPAGPPSAALETVFCDPSMETFFYGNSRESFEKAVEKFFRSHREDGFVVYFLEKNFAGPEVPCAEPWPSVYRMARDGACLGIYRARDVRPPLPA